MKAVIIALFAILAIAVANDTAMKDMFLHFQQKYKKVYASQSEFDQRFQIFKENMKSGAELQKKNPKARFGVTKFSDLSKEEFSSTYLMSNLPPYVPATIKTNFTPVLDAINPTNYDWAKTQYVSPVRDQGQCGSCWAFSATETIESYAALYLNKKAQWYSVEQIVDCDTAGQDQGCGGGWPYGAYEYVQSAGGIETETVYPYTAGGGESGTCAFKASAVVAKVSGYNTINGETGIYQQLSTEGPVSVCVDASTWSSYQGGVLTSCTNNVDHCVQATGYAQYGTNGAYWIVRNSWGADWGEAGFIWIQIGQDLCSIGDYATIPTAT